MYDHVLHTPLSFFGTQGTSDVTSRLVGDSAQLQDGFKNVLGQSIQEPVRAAFFFGLALLISWKLTLVIILFAPLMMVAIRKFGKKMRRASRAAMQRSSDMLGQIEGTLAGELKHTAGRIEALAFTPDGSGIVCGTHKGCLELFDRAGGSAKWSTRTALRRIVALVVPPRGTVDDRSPR